MQPVSQSPVTAPQTPARGSGLDSQHSSAPGNQHFRHAEIGPPSRRVASVFEYVGAGLMTLGGVVLLQGGVGGINAIACTTEKNVTTIENCADAIYWTVGAAGSGLGTMVLGLGVFTVGRYIRDKMKSAEQLPPTAQQPPQPSVNDSNPV